MRSQLISPTPFAHTGAEEATSAQPSRLNPFQVSAPTNSGSAHRSAFNSADPTKSFHEIARQLASLLTTANPAQAPLAEAVSLALLEQFLVIRLLQEKGWVAAEQVPLESHFAAIDQRASQATKSAQYATQAGLEAEELDDPPDEKQADEPIETQLYLRYIAPLAQELNAAGLLSRQVPLADEFKVPDQACQLIVTNLWNKLNFGFAPAVPTTSVADQPAERTSAKPIDNEGKTLTPGLLGQLLGNPLPPTVIPFKFGKAEKSTPAAKRPQRQLNAPQRVANWAGREILTNYLIEKLSDVTRYPLADLRQRLNTLFDLPAAPNLTDHEIVDLHNLFLRSESQHISRALLACRICDPAVGTGAFLAQLLALLADLLAKLDVQLYGPEIVRQQNYEFRLKRKLINDCLFGLAKNETEARLARQQLWFTLVQAEQSQPDTVLAITMREAAATWGLCEHIRSGDNLLGCRTFDAEGDESFNWRSAFPAIFNKRGGFDLIVSNTPVSPNEEYLANKETWGQICAIFPQLKRIKNPLAAFFDLPRLLGTPSAFACLIVPRSVALADGWPAIRAGLRLNYNLLQSAEMSEMFNDARLDQEVLLYARLAPLTERLAASESTLQARRNDTLLAHETAPLKPLTEELVSDTASAINAQTSFQTQPPIAQKSNLVPLPDHLSETGRELAERLATLHFLDEFTLIKHGQRWLRPRAKAESAVNAKIAVPVIKGTNVRQFRITDELPRQEPPAYIQRVLEELRQPKLVCPATIAHLKKPFHTLVPLCAIDRKGGVALDSVNQIFPLTDCPFSLEFLCALLNSSLARWYFTNIVYVQAVRAVPLTPTELARLPLPRAGHPLIPACEKLVRKLFKQELPQKYFLPRQQNDYDALDELVCELYDMNEAERSEILHL